MDNLNIQISVCEHLYLKNPESSILGKNIISQSIIIIDEIGFESFTFKKLSNLIKSPESSIYRYFDSKHSLLSYLTSWYWAWVEFRIVFAMVNIDSSIEKLKRAMDVLTHPVQIDKSISHINEVLLNQIIVNESIKAYHTKEVDSENEKGYFRSYKNVVKRVSEVILEINPKFAYPHMLVSTIMAGVHQQQFFAIHLPSLTDVKKGKDSVSKFYTQLVFDTVAHG